MPEGPEVKRTVEYLNDKLKGKVITDWSFYSGKYIENEPLGYEDFYESLPLRLEKINCKGKFIYFILENNHYIMHSLMMSGRWQEEIDNHTRWSIQTEDGTYLYFSNPRGFATVEFTDDSFDLRKKLVTLGPNIMTDEFSYDIFEKKCDRYCKRNITSFLMDQNVFSGCGNYIKSEVLYRAKISPLRKVGDLSKEDKKNVYQALKDIPQESYEGKLIRQVYGQPNSVKLKSADGRVTHWNPDEQK